MQRLLLAACLVLCAHVAFAAAKSAPKIEPKFTDISFELQDERLVFTAKTNLPNGTLIQAGICKKVSGTVHPPGTVHPSGTMYHPDNFIDAAAPLGSHSPQQATKAKELKTHEGVVTGWFPGIYLKGMPAGVPADELVLRILIETAQNELGPENARLSGQGVETSFQSEQKIYRQDFPVQLPAEVFALPPHT